MKAWQIQRAEGPSGLELVEQELPKPGSHEVLVRIRAVSLNYRDLGTTMRERPGNLPLPFTICSDGAGEVVEVGAGVKKWKAGDRVIPLFFQDWPAGGMTHPVMKSALGGALPGVLAEQVLIREDGLVRMPASLTFEQAATLPCAALTAWNAMIGQGHLQSGDTVLTLGTGGVSLFALQFAKLHGARVIITSSSDEKLARARELGADEVINYKTKPDWEREAFALTQKRGVDQVIELGGAGTLQKSLDAVRYGGRVSLIGVLTGFEGMINPWPIIARSITVQGIYVGNREHMEAMLRAIDLHKLEPVIDKVFPFEEARAAFEHMAAGAHFGKIVISV
ncbi:MAG TPA: NAD(P)-dependent alcohol dehydrogenase [Candidatus Saccharimonadia bacterium]|nr:NAD(P)-dependent alcohol dehydrogenase [Candidatus Saccharimonadia bacterium]